MTDAAGRDINYMRVSITDRCNLRCIYCMPKGLPAISHGEIMRYEEILRVCGIAAKAGIRAVKVTGGEPLVRKGCMGFLKALKSTAGIEHVTMTTNGVLLEPYISDLAEMSIDLNISIDSANPKTYNAITGSNEFFTVWNVLYKAVQAGLRVKVNTVPIRGINDDDIIQMARIIEALPIDVRFIEIMPTTAGESLKRISGSEIFSDLTNIYTDITPDSKKRGFGPARYFTSSKLKGSVGLIDAVENSFCSACNRVRLTCTGYLKLCLFSDTGVDLRKMIRGGARDSAIEEAFRNAVYKKPKGHMLTERINGEFKKTTASEDCNLLPARSGMDKMSRIGG